jgi:hypothetical protein
MGSITLTKLIPANTFCGFAESITRWKCAKRKCKTFLLLHHRAIELTDLTTPGTAPGRQQLNGTHSGHAISEKPTSKITRATNDLRVCKHPAKYLIEHRVNRSP